MAGEIDKRIEVCRRHGISEGRADQLHGSTPEQWEADAAARAAIGQMLGGLKPKEPETPETEQTLPPRSKAINDWTAEERAAWDQSMEHSFQARLDREQREKREAEERQQAEADRTDDQRLGDYLSASASPGSKAERDAAFIAMAHGTEPEVSDGFDGGAHGRGIAPPDKPPTEDELGREHGNWIVDTFPHRDAA